MEKFDDNIDLRGEDRASLENYDPEEFEIEGRTLVAYLGCSQEVYIPSFVTRIGEKAFSDIDELESVFIPSGVREICFGAFCNCPRLASIIVDDANERYKSEGNCVIEKSLSRVICGTNSSVIPDYVMEICERAFYGCENLRDVVIPDSVKVIAKEAFFGCSSLVDVKIPSGVTRIGDSAFYWCLDLASVDIPASVKEIGAGVSDLAWR